MTVKQFDNLLLGDLGLLGASQVIAPQFTAEDLETPELVNTSNPVFPLAVRVPVCLMRELIGGLLRPCHLLLATRPFKLTDTNDDLSKKEITRMWAWTWNGDFWAQRDANEVLNELLQQKALFDLATS